MRQYLWAFFTLFTCMLSAQEAANILVTYESNNTTLEEIFDDLESQYGIRFSYATSSIKKKRIDAKFTEQTIDSVLDFLLADVSMEYKIVSNNVLLRKSKTFIEEETPSYRSRLHVKGKIINQKNQNLDYATVSISNTSIGTYTDAQGRFDIEIPQKHINESIIVQYLGYAEERYKISELDDQFLLIPMEEGPVSFDEVLIVNKEKPIKIGGNNNSIQINKSQINSNTSGVMGADIGRQIQLLPGITAHEDDSAAIKIRGSNSDETLMVLDGMPIYNASHYYGIFSGVNTAYIDSVNVFKNTYPLQYGGKTAGLVELFSNDDQPSKSSINLDVNLLTASADVILPLSNNSQFSIAGRSTYKAVNNNQFNTVKTPTQDDATVQSFSERTADQKNDPSFKFYDINAKYQYRNKHNDFFAINLFKSSDKVNNEYKSRISDKNDNELNLIALNNQSWSNLASSMIYRKQLNPGLKWNTTAYYTRYQNDELNDLMLDKKNKQGGGGPGPIPMTADLSSNQNNELTDISLDSHVDYSFGNQLIKMGLMTTHHDINYSFAENRKVKLVGNESFLEMGGYIGHEVLLSNKFKATTALRATYFTNLSTTTLSPRLSLNYKSSDLLSFKSSFIIENQVIRQFNYEYRGEPMDLWVSAGSNNIPMLKSTNFMVGSTFKLMPFVVDIELYQKYQNGVLEYFNPNPADASNNADQERNYELFIGDGITRGIDIIVSSGYKNYDTYLSYTLSQSEERYQDIFNNNYFPSENDRRHQLKWVNTLTTGNFEWGLNGIFVSGRPYTDIRNVGPNMDIRQLDPNNRLKRLRAYHRLDISGGYNISLNGIKASLTASVFNLMNTNNVKYIQSISTDVNANQQNITTIIGNESELLNRTFNLGLKVSF